jgi:hypothetical protein
MVVEFATEVTKPSPDKDVPPKVKVKAWAGIVARVTSATQRETRFKKGEEGIIVNSTKFST